MESQRVRHDLNDLSRTICVCICVYIYIFFWCGSTVKFVYSSAICQASFFFTNPVFIHLWCSSLPKCISISCITQKQTYICVYVHISMDIRICIRDIQPLDITSGMFCQYSLWIALCLNSVRFNSAVKRKTLHILYPTQPLPWIPSAENWKQSEIAMSTWIREKI